MKEKFPDKSEVKNTTRSCSISNTTDTSIALVNSNNSKSKMKILETSRLQWKRKMPEQGERN